MNKRDYIFFLVLIIVAVIIAAPVALFAGKDDAWQIGDDIKPWPTENWTDCDDATLYTYYFISGAKPDYNIEIMYSRGKDKSHTWLLVTGDGKTIAYNNGKPVDSNEMTVELVENGFPLTLPETLYKLIFFVEQDIISGTIDPIDGNDRGKKGRNIWEK
jgi:hypothetical protein